MRFSVTKFSHQVFAEFQENPRTRRPIGGGAGTWKQCPDGKKSFHFSIYNFKILPVNCYNLCLEPKCSFLKLCPRLVGRESSTSWWKGSEAFVVHLAWLSGDLQVGAYFAHLDHIWHFLTDPSWPRTSWSTWHLLAGHSLLLFIHMWLWRVSAPSLCQVKASAMEIFEIHLLFRFKTLSPQGCRPKIDSRAQWPPGASWAWGTIGIARNAWAPGQLQKSCIESTLPLKWESERRIWMLSPQGPEGPRGGMGPPGPRQVLDSLVLWNAR